MSALMPMDKNAADPSRGSDPSPGKQRKRKRVRRKVLKLGRKVFRGLGSFLGRQSLVPNTPVLEKSIFPFVAKLEANWLSVREELDRLLEKREQLPPFHMISPDQSRISQGQSWKVFLLWGFGKRSDQNCRLCPKTAQLLDQVPRLQSAWFSIIGPGYRIPTHRGVTKGILRIHLGLKVPRDYEHCWMDIGGERVEWHPGECVVFDDTRKHSVVNDTNEERVVLIVDFDRPMRRKAMLLHRAMVAGLKLSPYFQDARRNQQAWEENFGRSYEKLEEALN